MQTICQRLFLSQRILPSTQKQLIWWDIDMSIGEHAPQNQYIIMVNTQEHKDNLFMRDWT